MEIRKPIGTMGASGRRVRQHPRRDIAGTSAAADAKGREPVTCARAPGARFNRYSLCYSNPIANSSFPVVSRHTPA